MMLPEKWLRYALAEDGASSVEYGLLMAGIALAIFASVFFLGQVVADSFFKPAETLIR
ncbi:MAG: Flp family type IVb pilin [Deltaproteobacteria bacterium]|nr:Flp family type IVb pilin [Deltaproteobacteria bacterium]